jgi:inactivated superfamily I helicase
MPRLYNIESGELLRTVSEADIQKLVSKLEEEHSADNDYFINQATVDILEEAGASAALIAMLRQAVGASEGLEVRYER